MLFWTMLLCDADGNCSCVIDETEFEVVRNVETNDGDIHSIELVDEDQVWTLCSIIEIMSTILLMKYYQLNEQQ